MLGLLDHHGVSRAEAYRSMTESAVAALIDRINDDVNVLPTNKLLEVRAQHPNRRPQLDAPPLKGGARVNQRPAPCAGVRTRRVVQYYPLAMTTHGQRPSASVSRIVGRVTTTTTTTTVTQVLEASFSYIKLPELRAVPLAILNRLNPIPAAILKQLSDDPELFDTLPARVQPQVLTQPPNRLP
jgi:hypothetical protein